MKSRGFTLIELLVVIAIIGLLATMSVVAFGSASSKTRDAKRKNDLKQMQKALEMYFDNNNAYPSTGGPANWQGMSPTYGGFPATGPGAYIPNLSPTYMGKLGVDPTNKASALTAAICGGLNSPTYASYLYTSDGTNYKLLAYCTIESVVPSTDPFYDPARPTGAYKVCSGNQTACDTW